MIYKFPGLVLLVLLSISCSEQKKEDYFISGVHNPIVSLDGSWKFSMDTLAYQDPKNTDFSSWSKVMVPGELAMQGYAIKHDRPYYYARQISMPINYLSNRIILKFHGVYSKARVWINGNYVRSHTGGFTAWECDITDFVSPGSIATLVVEIIDNAYDISYGSGYAKHQVGGILRSVELMIIPEEYIRELYLQTELDDDYVNAVLKVSATLETEKGFLYMELFDPDARKVEISSQTHEIRKGENIIEYKLDNPLKWDSEHPNLYQLKVTQSDADGFILGSRLINVGIREVEIAGNRMLVNGDPVKLRGVCRHDIHPLLGRTTTPEYDLMDVLLAKEANINFIRTSHYPPSETFLDFCDQYGIYVEDETAVCFIASHRAKGYGQDIFAGPVDDNQYLSQVKEMLHYHRNHPSVIMWSVGNENVYNNNFKLSYDFLKKEDPGRPVIFSYPGEVPDTVKCYDILSMHYPSYKGDLVNQRGVTTLGFEYESMPVIYDEWAHVACYNKTSLQNDPGVRNFWGQSLDRMWSGLYDSEGGLGGAIWGYIDETFMLPDTMSGYDKWWGIVDETILPGPYEGPVVGYGEWGILDTWRRKKPEFWNTKKAYSPIKLLSTEIKNPEADRSLAIYNRFNHSNLNEVIMTWSTPEFKFSEPGPDLNPGQKGEITVPDHKDLNADIVNLIFSVGDRIIDEYNISLVKNVVMLPESTGGEIELIEKEGNYSITGEKFKLVIDSKKGLIKELSTEGEMLIVGGGRPGIIVPKETQRYSTKEMIELHDLWIVSHVEALQSENSVEIDLNGFYGKSPVNIKYHIYADGLIEIEYEISGLDESKRIQEAGLYFKLADEFSKIEWERKGHWSAYPPDHPGSNKASIDIRPQKSPAYRTAPDIRWWDDNNESYYLGIENSPSISRNARSQKENFDTFTLISNKGNSMVFYGKGHQAARLNQRNEAMELRINSMWDYSSLLWGNYDKGSTLPETIKDKIVFKIN